MPDKLFTIVAGVNGVGKSTYIAKQCVKDNNLGHIVDPDKLAARYGSIIAGGRAALKEIDDCIENGIAFTEETTLSGKHVAETIKKAKANGYTVKMVYIGLDSAEECIARVADRVKKGGHYIPEDIIHRRFETRFEALKRGLSIVDYAEFYDNMKEFELIARYSNNRIDHINRYPAWMVGL